MSFVSKLNASWWIWIHDYERVRWSLAYSRYNRSLSLFWGELTRKETKIICLFSDRSIKNQPWSTHVYVSFTSDDNNEHICNSNVCCKGMISIQLTNGVYGTLK